MRVSCHLAEDGSLWTANSTPSGLEKPLAQVLSAASDAPVYSIFG